MNTEGIAYREAKDIPAAQLQRLFLEEQWNEFLDPDEVQLHIDTALHIISAWLGDELIGYGRLEGDGRIWVQISDVLVKSEHQGKGVGTEIMRRLVERSRALDPYFIQATAIKGQTEHLFEKFGFTPLDCNAPMELRTERLPQKVALVRGEQSQPE